MKGLERRPSKVIHELRTRIESLDADVIEEMYKNDEDEKRQQAEELGKRVSEFFSTKKIIWVNESITTIEPISTFANPDEAIRGIDRATVVGLPIERYVMVIDDTKEDLPLKGFGSRRQLRIQGGLVFTPGEERVRGDQILRAEVDRLKAIEGILDERAKSPDFSKKQQQIGIQRGKDRVKFVRDEISSMVVQYLQFSLTEAWYDPNAWNEEANRYGLVRFNSLLTCRVSEKVGSNEDMLRGYGPLEVYQGVAKGNDLSQFEPDNYYSVTPDHPLVAFLDRAATMRRLTELYPSRYEQ